MKFFRHASLGAIAASLVFPAASNAQSNPADEGSDGADNPTIVVTASRREVDLQDTAVSASVLTGELLEDKGVRELYELQYAAPSVNIASYGSANVFNIRGIGRSQVDIDVPSGVVIYRDGAPTVAGYFQREPYFDVGSVEVYRGPQGTFAGKSAAGGAVFINTVEPKLGIVEGYAEAGLGNYDYIEGTAVVNVPLGDNFAIRAGIRHEERDHWYEDIVGDFTGNPGDVDNWSYRIAAKFEPDDQFSAMVKLDYHDLDFGGNVTTQAGEPLLGVVTQNLYGNEFQYLDKSLRIVGDLNYETPGGVTFGSLTAYQDVETHNNLDAFTFGFLSTAFVEIFSQEFNIKSPEGGTVEWIVGGFYEDQSIRVPGWRDDGFVFLLNDLYPFVASPWDKNESTLAAFAHLKFKLNEQMTLETGARYSRYKLDQATEFLIGSTLVPLDPGEEGVAPFGAASEGGDYQELSEGSVDWQVSLNYEATPDQFFYGLVSRGHVTSGINLFPPFVQYDEMKVVNVEAGWKGAFANRRLTTQFSVFKQFIEDYQANFAEEAGVINFPANRNATDDSSVWGLEFSAQYSYGGFSLDMGAAYLKSKLGEFSGVTNPLTNEVVDLTGASSPFSPEFIGNIGISYEIPLGDNFSITPRIDVAHTSETQAALWFDEEFTLEARTLMNVRLDVGPNDGPWKVTLWSTNTTDKTYIAGIQNNATLYYAGAPRQYGARLRYEF